MLRFGKFSRSKGPGLYFTIPFIEQTALKADQRIMVTGFGAEETLTSDLVPINVDAVLFWMVWDAEKACLEVENYYNSVSLVAQTALRDAIGRASVSEVAIRRNQLDQELQEVIEERTSLWGITVLSVEIRDIVIPQELQEVMSTEAQAEREKNARMVLAEVEKDISAMLVDAAHVYEENEVALRLRTMHLLYESVKGSGGTVVIPSAYSEGFSDAALNNATDSLKTPKIPEGEGGDRKGIVGPKPRFCDKTEALGRQYACILRLAVHLDEAAGVGVHDEAGHAHVRRHDGVVRHHVDALAHGLLGVAEAG